MRFQTKLVLTLVMVVTGVTVALIVTSGVKIRQTYLQQFSTEFQSLLSGLENSRKSRSDEFLELCRGLAVHPFVISSLNGSTVEKETRDNFWQQYLSSLKELDGPRPSAGGSPVTKRPTLTLDIVSKLGTVAVMGLDGSVNVLNYPAGGNERLGKFRRINTPKAETSAIFEKFLSSDTQQTLFIPMEYPDRKPVVQEMVSTPVKDPQTGAPIGLFLRSTSAETDAERSLERYQEDFKIHDRIKNGIYVGGEVYSRSLDDSFAASLNVAIADHLEASAVTREENRFEASLTDGEYLVYLDPLTGDLSPRPAYQVAAFPITGLRHDLNEVRLRGTAVGATVLVIAIGIAFLLARNLSVPLNELAAGTRAIRSGQFDHRVTIRSADEIGELAASFNEMAEELKHKALYRELLGKVSDEAVAQALVSGTLDLELGGEIKDVAVLFCDIRGFTQLTEEMRPGDVIALLNEHMTTMTELVRKHHGVVDKFVGDEIMAVFGALKSYGNDAANAAACALEMVRERELRNAGMDLPIEIGIGVTAGEVVAGCMGSVDRLNYTVLGARVNLASRLCGVAESMQVITDEETIRRIKPAPETALLPDLSLKGFSKPVQAFRLISMTSSKPADEPTLKR